MPRRFVSLMYHNVVRDDDAGARADAAGLGRSITSYFVGATAFAQQLDAIAATADVLSYANLRPFFDKATDAPAARPLVQLTFDDGWRGTVDVAGPLLAERGLQAMLFVTTGLIGAPRFLAAAELSQLPRETFHLGSHTVTHRFLNELPDAEIRDELRQSRHELEDIAGYEVDTLSIPNGACDQRVVKIAAECGYRYVFRSDVHANSPRTGPLNIGRAAIRATTRLETVARYLQGDLRRERLRSTLLSLPKRTLGPHRYRQLRQLLLGQVRTEHEMCDLVRSAVQAAPPAMSHGVYPRGTSHPTAFGPATRLSQ
ncbi:MAG: polysaccharide deacetylase family protein [Planctomycetaceae bacterium]|nr:polysaccharide deacetylase family protein [Planctomycetaceae bacterium]